jgi:hypothetical protein
MKNLALACSLALALVACKKKDDTAASADKTPPAAKSAAGTAPAEPAPPPAPPPTPVAKSEYKADELFAATAGQSRMDLMEKFKDGVTVTGSVTKVDEPAGGEYSVELDAGDKHVVAVTFADFGKAAKAKGVKAGDTITATTCQVTNPTADRLAVVTCELK